MISFKQGNNLFSIDPDDIAKIGVGAEGKAALHLTNDSVIYLNMSPADAQREINAGMVDLRELTEATPPAHDHVGLEPELNVPVVDKSVTTIQEP